MKELIFRIYLWSEFLEVMTSSSIEKSERSGVLTGNNEIKGFGHSNLEEQVQIIEHMLSTIKGRLIDIILVSYFYQKKSGILKIKL